MSLTHHGDLLSAAASRRLRRRLGWVSGLAAALSVVGLVLATGATAEPTPTVASVKKQVDKLQHEAEVATEKYNATRIQQQSTTVLATAAKARLEKQKRNVELARKALGRIAAENYKAGDLQTLSLLLDDDPQNAMAAGGLMTSLTDRQAQGVQRLVQEQRQLAADQADLAAQKKQLDAATQQIGTLTKQIKEKLASANALLNRLKGRDRQALLTASRTLDRQALTALGVEVPDNGALTCDAVNIDYPDARVKKVLDWACKQLGLPYRWGGEGPGSYDCSGLTMRAWQQVGVSLPHNAAMQFQEGTRISLENLRPGDLIFFHSPPTHEGIYLGKGLMLHAPRTGDVVKIAPARLAQASGAVRL